MRSEITSQAEVMQKLGTKQETSEIFFVYLLRANDQWKLALASARSAVHL